MNGDQLLRIDDENPTVFVLKRELSEVHLLLDNLSTNPAKSLASATKDRPAELKDDWITRICRMNWPPNARAPDAHGDDAALLIRAKDYLNTLTAPANGASIAFTLLVTQDDDGDPKSLRSWFRGGGDRGKGSKPPTGAGGGTKEPPTRRSLAEDAYPGLIQTAVRFRYRVMLFGLILALALVGTSLLSWYTAFGNITLAERATAQSKLDDANKRVTDLESGNKLEGVGDAQQQPMVVAKAAKVGHLCPDSATPAYGTISAMQACEAKTSAEVRVKAINVILKGWLGWWPLDNELKTNNIDLIAGTLVSILGTALLPVLYGMLGAASAVVRTLSSKIKTSQLTPRDIQLLLQQLLLGTVTGSCISLFVAQPAADHATSPGLVGAVALSASALSFVAGFGVDQVYTALDALIRRVFLVGDPPVPAK